MTIEQSVGHPLKIHKLVARPRRDPRAASRRALERVGLAPAEQFMEKYPGDLSGGQKQRAVMARAIILNPVLLVADEPVSMLDMSVRAKILELMLDLKRDFDLTYLYITHDLATAKFFCDRIAIMYLGRIVEIGPADGDLRRSEAPVHEGAAAGDPGARPAPERSRATCRAARCRTRRRPPLGCSFHPRCPQRVRGLRLGVARPARPARGALGAAGEEQYEAERGLVGDLSVLGDGRRRSVRMPTARGAVRAAAGDARRGARGRPGGAVLARRRSGSRRSTAPSRSSSTSRDRAAAAPAQGDVEVECHLYDEAAEGRRATDAVRPRRRAGARGAARRTPSR